LRVIEDIGGHLGPFGIAPTDMPQVDRHLGELLAPTCPDERVWPRRGKRRSVHSTHRTPSLHTRGLRRGG
jgi:hypothetical protein